MVGIGRERHVSRGSGGAVGLGVGDMARGRETVDCWTKMSLRITLIEVMPACTRVSTVVVSSAFVISPFKLTKPALHQLSWHHKLLLERP